MPSYDDACVFCRIATRIASPANVVCEWPQAIAIVPLNPVTDGHRLVIPRQHVVDARQDPVLTGQIAGYAAELAVAMGGDFNLIVNAGRAASQTIWHLHWHVVPRRWNDGLHLPWTGQHTA
jgi:histidine triad (HIT) family protein